MPQRRGEQTEERRKETWGFTSTETKDWRAESEVLKARAAEESYASGGNEQSPAEKSGSG